MLDGYDFLGMLTLGLCDFKHENKKEEYRPGNVMPKKYSFRPETLEKYIGQDNAKERIRTYVEKVTTLKPAHLLISGTKGHGKSTLAYIIANMTGFHIDTFVGGSFTMENLIKFLNDELKRKLPSILFIDEIHDLGRNLKVFNPTILFPLLEDFTWAIGGTKVRPFIFIGATTDPEKLEIRFAPLVDRCSPPILNLEHYSSENIKQILKQYNDQLYHLNIAEEVYDKISKNSRFNPRTSISMFEDFIIAKDINRLISSYQIVKDSLTTKDIIVLKHLIEIGKPIGVEVLAIITQQTRETYTALQEPFLIQQGYISRTARGRIITEKGKLFLQEIKKEI